MTSTEETPMSLGEEMRSVARARILRAACAVLARQGFDCTVDDIAIAAGVSRRTVFRYFESHGKLLAAAAAEIIDGYRALVLESRENGAGLDAWLLETAVRFHTFTAEQVGQAFWDVYSSRSTSTPELVAVLDERLGERHDVARTIAQDAWRAAGGRGAPASWVVEAFLIQLSGFAHRGLQAAGDPRMPEDTARVSAKILSAVLALALREQKPA